MLLRAFPRVSAVLWIAAACLTMTLLGGADFSHARGCKLGTFDDQNPPKACWRPFSAESPFNRTLPRPEPGARLPLIRRDRPASGLDPASRRETWNSVTSTTRSTSRRRRTPYPRSSGGVRRQLRDQRRSGPHPQARHSGGGSDGHPCDRSIGGWQYDSGSAGRVARGRPLVITWWSHGLAQPARRPRLECTAAHSRPPPGRSDPMSADGSDRSCPVHDRARTNGRRFAGGGWSGSVARKTSWLPMGQHFFWRCRTRRSRTSTCRVARRSSRDGQLRALRGGHRGSAWASSSGRLASPGGPDPWVSARGGWPSGYIARRRTTVLFE